MRETSQSKTSDDEVFTSLKVWTGNEMIAAVGAFLENAGFTEFLDAITGRSIAAMEQRGYAIHRNHPSIIRICHISTKGIQCLFAMQRNADVLLRHKMNADETLEKFLCGTESDVLQADVFCLDFFTFIHRVISADGEAESANPIKGDRSASRQIKDELRLEAVDDSQHIGWSQRTAFTDALCHLRRTDGVVILDSDTQPGVVLLAAIDNVSLTDATLYCCIYHKVEYD